MYSITTKDLIVLFKLYGESLSEIIGHGIKALSYNIGKNAGYMLADNVALPEISDAIDYIKGVLQNSVKIEFKDSLEEIKIDYTLVNDMYGFDKSKDALWLTFYLDGIIAGMLEKITKKKTNIKSDYIETTNKVLITEEEIKRLPEQVV